MLWSLLADSEVLPGKLLTVRFTKIFVSPEMQMSPRHHIFRNLSAQTGESCKTGNKVISSHDLQVTWVFDHDGLQESGRAPWFVIWKQQDREPAGNRSQASFLNVMLAHPSLAQADSLLHRQLFYHIHSLPQLACHPMDAENPWFTSAHLWTCTATSFSVYFVKLNKQTNKQTKTSLYKCSHLILYFPGRL